MPFCSWHWPLTLCNVSFWLTASASALALIQSTLQLEGRMGWQGMMEVLSFHRQISVHTVGIRHLCVCVSESCHRKNCNLTSVFSPVISIVFSLFFSPSSPVELLWYFRHFQGSSSKMKWPRAMWETVHWVPSRPRIISPALLLGFGALTLFAESTDKLHLRPSPAISRSLLAIPHFQLLPRWYASQYEYNKKKWKFKVAAMLTSKDKRGWSHKPCWIHDTGTLSLFPQPLHAFSKTCPALASAWKRVCLQPGACCAVVLFSSMFLEFVWAMRSALLQPEMQRSYQVTRVSVTCTHHVLKVQYVGFGIWRDGNIYVYRKICLFDLCHEKINTSLCLSVK